MLHYCQRFSVCISLASAPYPFYYVDYDEKERGKGLVGQITYIYKK